MRKLIRFARSMPTLASGLALLGFMALSPGSVLAQYTFPLEGPETVDLNPSAIPLDVSGVPAGSYSTFTVTLDWSDVFDAWSNESELQIESGATVLYSFNGATTGAAGNGLATTLTWTGSFASPYNGGDPLSLVSVSTYVDGISTWDNIEVTITAGGPPPGPANDDCLDADPIGDGVTAFDNTGATGVVSGSCGFSVDNGIWYEYTASCTGVATASTCNDATFDTVLSVWDACGGAELACNDDNGLLGCTGNTSELSFAVVSGTSYWVRVAGYNGAEGTGNLTMSCAGAPTAPANDDCGTAEALTVNPDLLCGSVTSGTVAGATASVDANPCGGTTNDDVWYSFVATATSHNISLINLAGSTADLYHAVYSGACGALTNLSCSDPNSSTASGLTIGNTYLLRVYTWSSAPGATSTFDVCIGTLPAAPANDDCASPDVLTVNPDQLCGSVTAGTITAATASADANACGGTTNDDVWYEFTATATEHDISLLNVTGSTTDLYHGVYSGACGALTNLSCSDPNTSSVAGLTIGNTYLLRVYSWNSGAQTTTFDVCIGTPPAPPANVDCAGALAISCGATVSGDSSFGNPFGTVCTGNNTAPGLWYTFTGANSDNPTALAGTPGDQVTLSTCDQASYDTKIDVFTGSCVGLTCVAGNDDGAGCLGFTSELSFATTVGEVYSVFVSGFGGGSFGDFDLTMSCAAPCLPVPLNDDCASAELITVQPNGSGTPDLGDNTCAAAALVNPSCDGFASIQDVWFTFNSGAESEVELSVTGITMTDVNVVVYEGSCGGTEVLCSDPFATGFVTVTPGTDYYVQVYSDGAAGEGTFEILVESPPPPPANDLCGDAELVTCGSVTSGTTVNASNSDEPGTCGTSLGTAPGVWYTVAGIDGQMFADLCGAPYDSKIGVFSGSCGALTCVIGEDDDFTECGDNDPSVNWIGSSGETYYIYVTGFSTAEGAFDLTVDCIPFPANNDCVNAQSLSLATYPNTSNSLGTLYGATWSGEATCTGFNDGADVYYSFNLPSENHVGITVNPFGGADVIVQVFQGVCGGTEVACIDNFFGTETELLENLAAGTYIIRVQDFDGATLDASTGQFLINVQQFPYANLQSNPAATLYGCNTIDRQLEDFVGAEPQTGQLAGILDYRWLVGEVGGGGSFEWQRFQANYATRLDWLEMEYNSTYNVFVQMLINHPTFGPVWTVYDGDYTNPNDGGASSCTIATSGSVTFTEVLPAYQGTNVDGDPYELCDFVVASNVLGADNFRWIFSPDATPGNFDDIVYTRGSGNPSVRLSWVNGLQPGVPYNVFVEARVGLWSSYVTSHSITLAGVPNVAVRLPYCGVTYAPNGYLLAESVCEADYYRFKFTPQFAGATREKASGSYVLGMGTINPPLEPGIYNVQVQVQQNGVLGDYSPSLVGDACEITISGAPTLPGGEAPVAQRSETFGNATLFPNPNAGSEVRMELDGLSDGNHEVMIQVYDIYGKLIQTDGFGHEGNRLSRLVRFENELAMGMYMVQIVVDGDRFATERLIVK